MDRKTFCLFIEGFAFFFKTHTAVKRKCFVTFLHSVFVCFAYSPAELRTGNFIWTILPFRPLRSKGQCEKKLVVEVESGLRTDFFFWSVSEKDVKIKKEKSEVLRRMFFLFTTLKKNATPHLLCFRKTYFDHLIFKRTKHYRYYGSVMAVHVLLNQLC